MMFSKKQLILVLGLSFALSACWKPESNNEKSEGASFNITSFEGKDEVPHEIGSKWKVPSYKIMNFTACIEERSTTAKARGQKFEVIDPVSGQIVASDLKTINTGCMTWQENLPYNYFAKQAYYIEMNRVIRGTGAHVGERSVVFYVNPWASDRGEKTKTVVYSRDSKIDAMKVASKEMSMKILKGEAQEKPRIWLSKVSVKSTKDRLGDEGSGAAISLEVSFTPKVELYDSSGAVYWKDIPQGTFKVFTHLLANDIGRNKNEKMILTTNAHPEVGFVKDGTVKIDRRAILSTRATDGRLELGLRVEAVDGPAGLEAFEGVFRMDEARKLTGGFSPTIKDEVLKNTAFSLDKYLATATNFTDLKKARQAMSMEPYTFAVAKPRYLKVGKGETATTRSIDFAVATRVVDNVLGDTVGEGTRFLLKFPDGRTEVVEADNEGVIRWNSKLTHKYYKAENYALESVRIFDESGKRLLGEKNFSINPWDDKFTFGFDRAEMDDKFFDEIKNRELIPSRFYIDQFSYHTLRFRYQIDKFMNLEVKKTILLELHPQVLRYSGIVGGRKVTEDLRDGIYLLKVAIQKDYLDPSERNVYVKNKQEKKSQKKEIEKKYYVDVVKKLVQVFDGHIITPVELSMSDLRLMRVRSQFLIQLETVDEEKLQAINLVSERDWSHLSKRRQKNSNMDLAEEDDVKREKIRENLMSEKKKRTQALTSILRWLDEKSVRDEGFAKQNGLSVDDERTLFKRLEVNDFSKFDLSPTVELNDLIDKDSGLERRTFIGPMIFLSNAYSDSVRPTDSLTEVFCETNDCNAIEEKRRDLGYSKSSENYEHNPYFGSIAHLADTHVDDYIAKKLALDDNYHRKMPQIASLGNFADSFGLHLVTLGNEQFTSIKEDCDIDGEASCNIPSSRQIHVKQLPFVLNDQPVNGVSPLTIKHLNTQAFPPSWNPEKRRHFGHSFAAKEFNDIWSSKVLSPHHAEWVCHMIAGRTSDSQDYSYHLGNLYKECLNEYMNDPEGFIIVDRKLRVNKTDSYEFRGGKQMNLNVGSSFSVGHSSSTSLSSGVEAEDVINAIPMIGGFLKNFVKPLGLKIGSSESVSFSDGTSVSEQTYLVMQMANFMVELNQYERCFILRPSPDWLKRASTELLKAGRNEDLRTKGLMMCSGEMMKKPISVMESYFYFTQHFTEGDMLDQYDLYNHPWLLALRGVRDFTHFAKVLRKQSDKDPSKWYSAINPLAYISASSSNGNTAVPWEKTVDKTGWPLDKMAETYRKILPSFPGLYTMVGSDEFIKDYPWEIEHTDLNFFQSKGFDSKDGPQKQKSN